MTREEAIKYLKGMKDECNDTFHKVRYATQEEALDMAIKALEQEPKTGHWIDDCGGVKCSCCGYLIDDCFYVKTYCTNCGAKMESEVEE